MSNNRKFDLQAYLTRKQNQVNDTILKTLQYNSAKDRIVHAMIYSLMAGGKRLRPVLCMAATEAVGGQSENYLDVACALEMIHTYSLIHDDLPAMDNDDLRRGKPTCHVAFDEATAILAGDALLTMAFQILSSRRPDGTPASSKWLEIIHIISRAAGYRGMIEGQMRDMAAEGKHLTIDTLKDLHSLKTGALIQASIRVGAMLGGGSVNRIRQLETYAKHIGLAFQVRDDILNIEGNPKVMGKAVGTDKSRNKNTFPALIGLERSKSFAKKLSDTALQTLNDFDDKADPLRAIARYIIDRKK